MEKSKYKPIIGLEIHVELKTKSKMFCSSLNNPNEKEPNKNVCPICMAHPGTLPVINKEAVRSVIKAGLSLNCKIANFSKFDRKNYFYPDLPKGYQVSQYDEPLCGKGFLEINGKKINITRIHLEEDTGKLIHLEKENCSLVDYNRAGVPLMELVTEPVIYSAKEAKAFAEELRLIFRYIGISEANMENGQMRCEANISVMKEDAKEFGTKVEIKNLNSFKALERGIDYEIKRQIEELENGGEVIQETRGWNESKEETFSQRKKEEAHDYRYFPEPDLPKLKIENELVNEIKSEIPELPEEKRKRFKSEYNIKDEDIETFVINKDLGEYFEQVISELHNWLKEEKLKIKEEGIEKLINLTANYIISDLQSLLKENVININECLITQENLAEFIVLIFEGKITSKVAKYVLKKMFNTSKDPSQIVEEEDLIQTSDEEEIKKEVKKVIKENKNVIEDFKRKGDTNIYKFLVGQVMAKTKGKADPIIALKIFKDLLS